MRTQGGCLEKYEQCTLHKDMNDINEEFEDIKLLIEKDGYVKILK
jgi:hypothetical protein|nr:MAG TPA: hypothetical protein [Caudoviricetes sp.]